MRLLRKEQSLVLWCFSASLLLSSCGGTGPECGSLDNRNSLVKIVSDDTNNKLVNYAVENSSSVAAMVGGAKSEAEKLAIWKKARQGAVYRLDDTILMNSRNRAAQEITCIGPLYVTVADATAEKEVEFYSETDTGWEDHRFSQSFFVLRFCGFESSVVAEAVSTHLARQNPRIDEFNRNKARVAERPIRFANLVGRENVIAGATKQLWANG
jgi:hypothetical protein